MFEDELKNLTLEQLLEGLTNDPENPYFRLEVATRLFNSAGDVEAIDPDYKTCAEHAKFAADKKIPAGECLYAKLLCGGYGVPQDIAQAFMYYAKALFSHEDPEDTYSPNTAAIQMVGIIADHGKRFDNLGKYNFELVFPDLSVLKISTNEHNYHNGFLIIDSLKDILDNPKGESRSIIHTVTRQYSPNQPKKVRHRLQETTDAAKKQLLQSRRQSQSDVVNINESTLQITFSREDMLILSRDRVRPIAVDSAYTA
jgi:hypothetical protein